MYTRHSQRGFSLVELIMFIAIVGVALAGILLVLNVTTRGSADPLIHKQALAIAESLLEEVELMPFTFCDPDDPAAATAGSTADCTAPAGGEVLEVENDVSRYDAALPFDNVSDYDGFNMAAGSIMDITNTNIGLAGYSASVTMTQPGLAGIAAADTLQINVTVTGPDNVPITLEGYRTRFAPNGLP